jgi:general secretion pathway protein L
MPLTIRRYDLAGVRGLISRAGAWWIREFLNLLPEHYAGLLRGRGVPTLVVGSAGQQHLNLQLRGAGDGVDEIESIAAENAAAAIDDFLSRVELDRRDVEIGVRLPADLVFGRELMLPIEALPSIDAIVAQDLARKTPFKADEIYCDHVIAQGGESGRITVRQWITRRQSVQLAADELGMPVADLTFVTFGDEDAAPLIRLSRNPGARNLWQAALPALCCSAVALVIVWTGLMYANQQSTLDRLEADIAVANRKAQQVRLMVDQLRERRDALVRLRLQRSEAPGLIDLWEEATRILPQHSWLTELRLVDGSGGRESQIMMSGFSGAAPSLVGIIDGSRLFFDTTLTSPVAFDVHEGRERFSLQAKIRSSETPKEMMR